MIGTRQLPPNTRAGATVVVGAAACVCMLFLAPACKKPDTPEVRIRAAIDTAVAALEKRDAKGAMAVVADDYADKGGRTRDKLKRIAFFMTQQGPLFVRLQSVDVQVQSDTRALVHVKALAVQGSAQVQSAADLLPQNAKNIDADVGFALDGGDWKIVSIDSPDLVFGDL